MVVYRILGYKYLLQQMLQIDYSIIILIKFHKMQVYARQYEPHYKQDLFIQMLNNREIQILFDKVKGDSADLTIDQHFQDSSGIIRGEWLNDAGKLHTICYGTGIAISKRIVLTCAHSVFLQKQRKICDSVSFVPNHGSGKLKRTEKVYRTTKTQFIHLQVMKLEQTFAKVPIPEDIALIYFSQDIQLDYFPCVGLGEQSLARLNSELMISGYPSKEYYANPNLNQIHLNRSTVKGELLQINANTIFHNLDTKTGHSGSGILGMNCKTKQVTVLGVHTHKGRKRNSGVYLSNVVLKKLVKYEIEFGLNHQEYKLEIKFPEGIQEEVYHSLSKEEQDRVRNKSKLFEKLWQSQHKPIYTECHAQDKDQVKSVQQDEDEEMELSFMMEYKEQAVSNPHKQEIVYSEEKNTKISNLQKMISQNNLLKQSLFKPHNQHLDIFLQWLKVENTYLKLFQSLQESNNKAKNDKLINEIEDYCSKTVQDLQKMKVDFTSKDKLQIVYSRFPSVQEHLSRCKYQSSEYLNEDKFDHDHKIYKSYEEQCRQLCCRSEKVFSSTYFDAKEAKGGQRTPSQWIQQAYTQ